MKLYFMIYGLIVSAVSVGFILLVLIAILETIYENIKWSLERRGINKIRNWRRK